jgi:DDE superfamily endonuclease
MNLAAGARPAFPPCIVVQVKALACELPHRQGLPLSRFSIADIRREVLQQGLVAEISGATIWRWLSQDAICPWRHRTWIFPRDPLFVEKAGPILDLYQGLWQGQPLGPKDFVLSADEKTCIQARRRKHASVPPAPGRPALIENEYKRAGAWVYLAAWDVGRAKVFGRCVRKNGSKPFDSLVGEVMSQEPYRSAARVFWIIDNCSSHRGQKCVQRLQARWPSVIPVHTPIHASWLNQIEIHFSVVQRKVLTPNDFDSLSNLEAALLAFQERYEKSARPFQWTFTREKLAKLMIRLGVKPLAHAA